MQKGYTLLSVDDDKFIQSVITSSLESEYNIITASTGQEGVALAKREQPDIILLDVEMPGMNGYEVCDLLKHDDDTRAIPVIFLSSLSNLRSRMLGYEAGGADFLVKPFEEPEIKAKINNLIGLTASNAVLKEQATSASDAAYTAMKGSSELGLAIHFVEHIFACHDIESIAKRFFSSSQQLGLQTNLMFVMAGKRSYFKDSGKACPPLEQDVMSTIFDRGQRIVDFGARTQISYPHVSVLIKNMPLSDMDAYGRFKDLMPAMLGAADAKLKTMEVSEAITGQTVQLAEAFAHVRSTLSKVGEQLDENQSKVVHLLSGVLNELEEKIPLMGLEDDQERYLIERLDAAFVGAQDLIEGSESTHRAFKSVTKVLQKLAEKQKTLAQDIEETQRSDDEAEAHTGEGVTGEVELF